MRVAFPTNNEEKIAKHIGLCKKIVIYANGEKVEVVENPIYKMVKEENLPIAKEGERHFGTGRILSQFLSEKNIDIFAAVEFYSSGLKQNLERLAITPYETQDRDIETVLQILSQESLFIDIERGRGRGRGVNRQRRSTMIQGRCEEKSQKMGLGRGQGMNRRRGQGRGRGMNLGRGAGIL